MGSSVGSQKTEVEDLTPIFDILVRFFSENEWEFEPLDDMEGVIQTYCKRATGAWLVIAQAREEQQQCMIYSVLPLEILDDKRAAIAEFITRANYGMPIGNFEMDIDDGEVRYKASISVAGDRLSFALVSKLIDANIAMMERYLPGFRAIVKESTSPAAAIAEIEQKI